MPNNPARKANADDVLVSAPKNRDQLVQENRRRDNRVQNNARDKRTAPDTDLIPEPRTQPATTQVVNQNQNPDASGTPLNSDQDTEVRAGPGDAGKQQSPELLDKKGAGNNGKGRTAMMLFGVGLGILLVAAILIMT